MFNLIRRVWLLKLPINNRVTCYSRFQQIHRGARRIRSRISLVITCSLSPGRLQLILSFYSSAPAPVLMKPQFSSFCRNTTPYQEQACARYYAFIVSCAPLRLVMWVVRSLCMTSRDINQNLLVHKNTDDRFPSVTTKLGIFLPVASRTIPPDQLISFSW